MQVPWQLGLAVALLCQPEQPPVRGVWPQLEMEAGAVHLLLAFVAWTVLSGTVFCDGLHAACPCALCKGDPAMAWRLFEETGQHQCILPSRRLALCEQARQLRRQAPWLAAASCYTGRAPELRRFLRMCKRDRRTPAASCLAVATRFQGEGSAAQERHQEMMAELPHLLSKPTVELHRLLCCCYHSREDGQLLRGLQPGNLACHTCGAPTCLNPKHLRWGSVQDSCVGRKSRRQQMAKNLGSYAEKGRANPHSLASSTEGIVG